MAASQGPNPRRNPASRQSPTRALERAARIGASFAREPLESLERVLDKRAERADRAKPASYQPEPEFLKALHAAIGARWPCGEDACFQSLWAVISETFEANELGFGRAAYGGWDDGDPQLARAVWCLVRHLHPRTVIETGVGRGVTTRLILEGLEKNGSGHLWSVDLPPLLERGLAEQTATAVTDALRSRWTFMLGSSRRTLPALVKSIGAVDMFVHDSFHSSRNLLFEWETVLPFLRPRAVLVADDVERHTGLASFQQHVALRWSLVGEHNDRNGLFAVVAPAQAAGPPSSPKV